MSHTNGRWSVSLGRREAAGFAQTAFSIRKLRDRENQQEGKLTKSQAKHRDLLARMWIQCGQVRPKYPQVSRVPNMAFVKF